VELEVGAGPGAGILSLLVVFSVYALVVEEFDFTT
jgi:hypothetical protein